ncbi:MAG: hypothetical protein ABH872_02245 [Candidatus Omnitrophota bacterium]
MKLADINECVTIWGPVSDKAVLKLKEENGLVIVPENRPYMLGLRHNIPALKKSGINCLYCSDNMLGLLLYKGKIKKGILFYKEEKDDGFLGVCGSLYFSLLCKMHNVGLEYFAAGAFDLSELDIDASTLDTGGFIAAANKESYVINANDEYIIKEKIHEF